MNWYVVQQCHEQEHYAPMHQDCAAEISPVEMSRILSTAIQDWIAQIDDTPESRLRRACLTLWD